MSLKLNIFLLLLLMVSFSQSAISADMVPSDEIKIFAKENGAPKHYLSENGVSSGYAVNIAVEAMKRAGFSPKVVHLPWKRAQQQALDGNGVITAFSKTPERQKLYEYTDAMYQERVILFYRRNDPVKFDSFDDLIGKKIGVSRGSNYSGEFEEALPKLDVHFDGDHILRLRKLASKRIDAGIFPGDIYLVRHNLDKIDLDITLFDIAEKPISIDTNHIGIPKNLNVFPSGQLKIKLDSTLAEMKVDGTIDMMLARYKVKYQY